MLQNSSNLMLIPTVSLFMFLISIMVVTTNSPVTSVVYLIATFIITAIYLSSQDIVYIALTYIIVYVGAVITLFLFVVIIINLGSELQTRPFTQTMPLTLVMVLLYTIIIVKSSQDTSTTSAFNHFLQPHFDLSQEGQGSSITGLSQSFTQASSTINHWNQIQSIGFELYTHQAMWLVLVSIVLMISIIGPIVICRK